MSSRIINRFSILCRIKYAACDQVIDFKLAKDNEKYLYRKINVDRNIQATEIDRSAKHQLCDIDRFTAGFSCESEMLKKISIIKDVYNVSAIYSSNGINRHIELIYNNELMDLLSHIENDKLCDNAVLRQKDLLVQKLSSNNDFSTYYLKSSYFKTKSIISMVKEIEGINKIYKSTGFDSEAISIIEHNKDNLLNEFNKYHLYRGLYLTYKDYQKRDIESKDEIPNSNEEEKIKVKKIEFNPYNGEQLKF